MGIAEALTEEDRKLVHGLVPRVRGADRGLGRVLDGALQQFGRRLVGREAVTRFDDLAEAPVRTFDRVYGVNPLTNRGRL